LVYPEPDLVISEKSETLVDGAFNVTYTVANIGGDAGTTSTTCIYVNGVQVATAACPALLAGQNDTNTVGPFDLSGCTINITVCADNANEVDESNETNNCRVNIWQVPDGTVCGYGDWEDDPANPCQERREIHRCISGSCTPSGEYEYQPKAEGEICGCTANNTLKRCDAGNCSDTGVCNSTSCGADVACDGKHPGEACGIYSTCNSTCKCVSPAPPNITSFAPPSPVNDTVCNWRTFNVSVNQTVNVSWYLNDSHLFTNVSVTEANYTLHAEVTGEHNVSAVATNANGTDMQTWVWNVSLLDNDGDGVSNAVEDGAPNGGDGNYDGIPDRDQSNVTSLLTATNQGEF